MSLFSFGTSSPPAIRAVPFNQKFLPGVVIFGLLAAVALWFGLKWTWENHLFADHARRTEGKVIQKYMTESHGKSGTTYTPRISYTYRAGNVIGNCDVVVPRDIWDQVHDGGSIPIKYLPEDLSDSRIDDTADDLQATMKGCVALGVGLLGLICCITTTVRGNRRKKLLDQLTTRGLSTMGRVTALDTERVGKQTKIFIRFEFTDNRGQVISGRTEPLSGNQNYTWTPNKMITVYYDPANSSVFTVNLNQSVT